MFEKSVDYIKTLFGFKGRKQDEFDDAVRSVLNAAADSRHCLVSQTGADLDTGPAKELSHAWIEASIRISRLDDGLRDECLVLAKAFAQMRAWDAEQAERNGERVESVLDKASDCLRNRGRFIK